MRRSGASALACLFHATRISISHFRHGAGVVGRSPLLGLLSSAPRGILSLGGIREIHWSLEGGIREIHWSLVGGIQAEPALSSKHILRRISSGLWRDRVKNGEVEEGSGGEEGGVVEGEQGTAGIRSETDRRCASAVKGDRSRIRCQETATHRTASHSFHRTASHSDYWRTLPSVELNEAAILRAKMASGHDIPGQGHVEALKWLRVCCPDLPRSLLHRLFREKKVCLLLHADDSAKGECEGTTKRHRVKEKQLLPPGTVLCIPKTLRLRTEKHKLKPQSNIPAPTSKERSTLHSQLHALLLYKDNHVLAFNKPAGLACQGGPGVAVSLDAMLKQAGTPFSASEDSSPCLVHRLDRDASGVIVVARNQAAASVLSEQFRNKTDNAPLHKTAPREQVGAGSQSAVRKSYWAIVIGRPNPPSGRINAPIHKVVKKPAQLKEERKGSQKAARGSSPAGAASSGVFSSIEEYLSTEDTTGLVQEGEGETTTQSQHAVTLYHTLHYSPLVGLSLVQLEPITGRKHQLRVHCSQELKAPILGDLKYGAWAHRKIYWQKDLLSERHLPSAPPWDTQQETDMLETSSIEGEAGKEREKRDKQQAVVMPSEREKGEKKRALVMPSESLKRLTATEGLGSNQLRSWRQHSLHLHAKTLTFPSIEKRGNVVTVTADAPLHFQETLEMMGFNALSC